MNRRKWLLFAAVVVLLAATAGALSHLRSLQRLGVPGIKATPVPGSVKMKFDLPAHVLDFTSTNVPEAQEVLNWLPKDTSFAQRRYTAPDGFWVDANIVLMGMDRTSIHKPEYCLPGHGWRILKKTTVNIPIEGVHPYQLQVAKWIIATAVQDADGRKREVHGLYVFWFVAHNEETTSHWQRIWWLSRDLLTTGVLQRWAYISYFAVCRPEQEDATFGRMKKLIAASVPQFQLPPKSESTALAAQDGPP